MSNYSRSPSTTTTPTPNTNLRLEEARSPAHPQQQSGEYTEPITVRLSPPPTTTTTTTTTTTAVAESTTTRLRRRAEDPLEEEPMAKRIRVSPQSRGRADSHSSPSSEDSQDDMADNEMDVGRLSSSSTRPEPLLPSSTTSAPPKKKRTRTLTTPHQSAVLHALLAQSRFPTTAMREEVGRSIGLSARKVQIWFQNQRQKSRRPRSQSDTPSNRPPQYGPFPTVSESASHHMSSTHAYEEHALGRVPYAHQQQHHQQPARQVSPRLLGPGMPGVSRYPPHAAPAEQPPPPYRLGQASMSSQSLAAPSAFSAHRAIHRALSPPPYRSPRMYSHPGTRPATSQPTASSSTTMSYRDFDPSRTLPPLVSTRPRSSSHHYGPQPPSSSSSRLLHSSGSAGSSSAHAFPGVSGSAAFPPLHAHPRSLSPEPMFAHQPPEPSPRPLLHLPPPFTLEPSPQWDEAAYSAVPRPSSSVWSRPSSRSTRGRSASPVASRHHLGAASETASPAYYSGPSEHPAPTSPRPMSSAPAITPPTASRGGAGRYDPIRASFNAVFPAPSASVRSPPYDDDDRHSGGGGRAEDPHRPPP